MTVTFSTTNKSNDAAAAAFAGAAAVFDVDALLGRCMGDAALAAKLLERFQQRLPKAIAEIERCLAEASPEQAIQKAHSLKGEAGSLAVGSLQQAAAELEHCLRSQLSDSGQAVSALSAALRTAAEQCQQHLPATLSALSTHSAA